MNNDLENRILEAIENKHLSSGGHCGLSPVDLCRNLSLDYSEVKNTLNHLHQTKQIKVKKGINSYLLFKNQP